MNYFILFCLLLLFFLQCSVTYSSIICEIHKTCNGCVRNLNGCKWCAKDNYNGTRCKPINENISGCAANIENPKSFLKIIENRGYSAITQIKPQKFQVKLRPGESADFIINFKGAEDYPADLYFLIDASISMEAIIKATADASKRIYEEMRTKTKNVLLGLGTFIDKNSTPYLRTLPEIPIYSFRHQLTLTTNFTTFENHVRNIRLQANHDDPEGGFDALAQAITCKNEIGWRNQSRKIIIFLTDQLSHTTGDGKWAGITQPYDGKCYTKSGMYTKELELDYPSISMINKLAAQEEVTIVFAVKDTVINEYEDLSSYIRGSKHIRFTHRNNKVEFDESQLENVISTIYKEITQTIKLKVTMGSESRKHLNVSFDPDCINNFNGPACNVPYGNEIIFKGKVKLLQYFGKEAFPIDIAIEGIKEKVTMHIDVASCECEKLADKDSNYCFSRGSKICGICQCNPGSFGERCMCSESNATMSVDDSSCKPVDAQDQPNCNGYGTCICGFCQCNTGFGGKYCECNKESCLNKCSGHGDCACGRCVCAPEWTGEACDCSMKPCRTVHGKVCNGRGYCNCGKCVCPGLDNIWDARYEQTPDCEPEYCPTCHSKQCSLLKDCALCQHRNQTIQNCTLSCGDTVIVSLVDDLKYAPKVNDFDDCGLQVNSSCFTTFRYWYQEKSEDNSYRIGLIAQTNATCTENRSYYWYGGGVLGMLLLVGILTLVAWRVLTELRDRQEYANFVRNQAATDGACSNPIYEPATTTFRNPAFRKPSIDNTLQ